jgi:hypothetical protein
MVSQIPDKMQGRIETASCSGSQVNFKGFSPHYYGKSHPVARPKKPGEMADNRLPPDLPK